MTRQDSMCSKGQRSDLRAAARPGRGVYGKAGGERRGCPGSCEPQPPAARLHPAQPCHAIPRMHCPYLPGLHPAHGPQPTATRSVAPTQEHAPPLPLPSPPCPTSQPSLLPRRPLPLSPWPSLVVGLRQLLGALLQPRLKLAGHLAGSGLVGPIGSHGNDDSSHLMDGAHGRKARAP